MREKLSYQFAIHDAELPENHFRGLASVFNTLIDAWIPTRILPGAFTKTLNENAHRVKVLFQHNPDWPIGVPTKMEENSDGLLVEAKISKTTMGQDTMILLRDKVITELSIGFDPIKHEMVEEQGLGMVRHVKEVRLWEFSPVTFAANRDARIGSVNSLTRDYVQRMSREDRLGLVTQVINASLPEELQTAMVALLTPEEAWAGKVLSAKNKALVNDAIAALQKLLEAAEPIDDESQSLTAQAALAARARELDLMTLRLSMVKNIN